jgi:acyl dehydratase
VKFFDDIRVGDRVDVGRYTFTAETIKAFAVRYDPQPFHLNEDAAARSHFRALCASGWHTACVWMRLITDRRRRESDVMRARGEPVAAVGVSPGFRDLQWLKPVYAGDTIAYTSEVVEARALASRPGWGLVASRTTGVNQRGEPVISFVSGVFIERRAGGGEAEP